MTAGQCSLRYLLRTEMLCLFHFVIESEKNSHTFGTAVVPENDPIFPFLFFLFNFNSKCQLIHPAVH